MFEHNKNKRYVQSYDNNDNTNDMNDDDSNEKNEKHAHKLRVTSAKYDKKGILRWVTTMEWNGMKKNHI